MALTNARPTIWSKAYMANLNKAHVAASVVNRDYEGEIRDAGDTVKISSIGRVTINTYSDNAGLGGTEASPTITAIARPEIVQGSSLFLTIDQQRYFNVAIDDVDKRQDQPKFVNALMEEAAYGIANTIDQFILQTIQTGVAGTGNATGNRLAAASIGTGAGDDDAYETLVDLMTKLKEADVVASNYWCVIPPWYHGVLQKDPRFTSYGTGENRQVLANGRIGRAAGFELLESNNLFGATSGTLAVAGGVYTLLAGVKMAVTYAEQLKSLELYRPDDAFADAAKGLHLYGCKVTRPFALASVACTAA